MKLNDDLVELKRLAKERKLINRNVIFEVIKENMIEHELIEQYREKLAKSLWKEAHEYILAAIEREERKRERKLTKEKSPFDFILLDKDDEDEN